MCLIGNRQLEIASLLNSALKRLEFSLYYQPQVDNLHKIVGVEALIRWQSPELGSLSPAEFIPIAEKSGGIDSIGEWVIRASCLQMKFWLDSGLCADSCYIAVNVSPYQLRRPNFVKEITTIVCEADILPHQIHIEITEGVFISDIEDIKQKLIALRLAGFCISVDDFGTGYSSLAYLKHFQIDVLKIDQLFIRGVGVSRNDEVISSSIISLAQSLGIKTVAEGVETLAQMQFLCSQGCDVYQGYYFSKPLTAMEMTSHLKSGELQSAGFYNVQMKA